MKYTALTIGPISKTFHLAKKTRELWAASYLFSYLMKNIIKKIKVKDNDIEVVLPFFDDRFLNRKYEAGLFSDRFIFYSKLISFTDINSTVREVVKELVEKMVKHLDAHEKLNKQKATDYLINYFQVYVVDKEFEDNKSKNEITKQMFSYLDSLELQPKFIAVENNNYLRQFLTKSSFPANGNHSFLITDSKDISSDEKVRFQSIIEISAKELFEKLGVKNQYENLDLDDDENIIKLLKEHETVKNDFRTHHKYISIVQIDGDNFGNINKQLNDDDFSKFSECLANYSLSIHEVITEYGGLAVYIGGDDILFFAPVRNGTKNIFTLIEEINKQFKKYFECFIGREDIKDDNGNVLNPSLSIGISITYYKHPLTEALSVSYKVLNEKAKKTKNKNAFVCRVMKHSGQQFETTFINNSSAYEQFKKLLSVNIDDGQFFSSVIQKFFANFEVLALVLNDESRIHFFIENYFNEEIHGIKKIFFNTLERFIYELYLACNKEKLGEKEKEQIKEQLYGSLRMVKFLNRKDNE